MPEQPSPHVMPMKYAAAGGLLIAVLVGSSLSPAPSAQAGGGLRLVSVSNRPDMISGGQLLVRVDLGSTSRSAVRVALNGRDVTTAFSGDGSAMTGLVEGLTAGRNSIIATAGRDTVTLAVTNYPVTGPIFSGPHATPFVCGTEASGLGAPLDANCSAPTRVDYFYRSTAVAGPVGEDAADQFRPLADPASRPSDLATLTLPSGRSVPFIVRVESGTINRAIYRIAILDAPSGAGSAAWRPGPAWNGKLQYRFGGGCGFGRRQSSNQASAVLDEIALSRGYALATSTLNVYGTACDDVLSAETAMMVKEHFIERYGVPRYVVGFGGSGGAMQQYLIADNYPGILDGLMPSSAFPDGLTLTHTPTDCALLNRYFVDPGPGITWSEAQRLAVSGFGLRYSCLDPAVSWGAFRTGGTNSVYPKNCLALIPASLVYDREKNPRGVRCTIFESLATYLGRDPQTGFVRRPIDNVGIQYGLKALQTGTITVDQFLDLNEHIGGFGPDGDFVPTRTVGDPEGIANAYRTGRIFSGKGTSLPILEFRRYNDLIPGRGDVHTRFHTFEIRRRLMDSNGGMANHVVWTWAPTAPAAEHTGKALDAMDQWLEALLRDTSAASYAEKVLRAKPATLVDGCWDPSNGARIDEPASEDPKSRCNTLFPIFGNARTAAGTPIQENIEKCTLGPINVANYGRPFTAPQEAAIRRIFPEGVCDFTRPGIGQQPQAGKWQSFGPASPTGTN